MWAQISGCYQPWTWDRGEQTSLPGSRKAEGFEGTGACRAELSVSGNGFPQLGVEQLQIGQSINPFILCNFSERSGTMFKVICRSVACIVIELCTPDNSPSAMISTSLSYYLKS